MTTDVEDYLQHGDWLPALRRLMDLALDTQLPEPIGKAIAISRSFRNALHTTSEAVVTSAFTAEARALLQAFPAVVPQSERVLAEAEGISKTYSHGNFSLKPISLALATGHIIGVVGENGNGKTTLLRCLAGQLAIDSGSIGYAGTAPADYYGIKGAVAFIPQRIPRWFGRLRDNLHFTAALAGITGARNTLLVEFMLERFGLADFAELTWNQISSGYRTRFEIARVLLLQPQVLILDEPLANLDINAQQTLLTDLRFLARSPSRPLAILLTSQQLHEVEKVADKVLLIRNGACVFRSGETDVQELGYALELETTATRDAVQQALAGSDVQVQFNGGCFTLVSHTHDAQALLLVLLSAGIRINYCRDISSSTKRLF